MFWSNTPSLLLPFAVGAPPGTAAGAAAAEFREASFGATLHHFCLPLLSVPPLGLLPVLNSEKLVLEQHSINFAYFCCPRPPLGLLPVLPLLNSEKLVLEQRSITFAYFCCPRPPGAAASVAGAESREASFGATLHHFCLLLLSPLGLLWVLLVLNSEKLVSEPGFWIRDP